MNLPREIGTIRPFLVLMFVFLILKGWVLVSLVHEKEAGSCLAEPAPADRPPAESEPRVFDKGCELHVGELIQRIKEEQRRLDEKAKGLEEKERRLQILISRIEENINKYIQIFTFFLTPGNNGGKYCPNFSVPCITMAHESRPNRSSGRN